jgi:hypothetical protein
MDQKILTKRERVFHCHDGNKFWFEKSSADGSTKFWVCSRRYTDECPARIHTKADRVIKEIHAHTHEAAPENLAVCSIRNEVKKRALETIEVCFVYILYSMLLSTAKH